MIFAKCIIQKINMGVLSIMTLIRYYESSNNKIKLQYFNFYNLLYNPIKNKIPDNNKNNFEKQKILLFIEHYEYLH